MRPRVVAIVQARLGSARLPGKGLKPVAGKPMILHVLQRAAAVLELDEVVLATSVAERDTLLASVVTAAGFRVFRGPEHDVLGRFVGAAGRADADVIVRLTGDCPLLAPDVTDRVVRAYLGGPAAFVSNDVRVSGYPDGTDTEVFSRVTLEVAARAALDGQDREHVTSWMHRHLQSAVVACETGRYGHLKWSVDCADDLAYVRALFGCLPASGPAGWTFAATLEADRQLRTRAGGMLCGRS